MTHTTGRELDAEIAERVFGLVPCRAAMHRNGDGLPCHAQPDSPMHGGETPSYSTSIADAWRVVEKMADRERYWWRIQQFGFGWDVWLLEGRSGPTEKIVGHGAGPLPLAICKAALAACAAPPEREDTR